MISEEPQRGAQISRFLAQHGWGEARLEPLAQDASTRRYIRLLRSDGARALLMDAPPVEDDPCPPDATAAERHRLGWNALTRLASSRVDAFVLIAGHLRRLGFLAPEVYAHSTPSGLALIEDFGEGLEFARLIERGMLNETEAYTAAAAELARLHREPVPDILEADGERWPLLEFDAVALAANADLYADWLPSEEGRGPLSGSLRRRWEEERDALIAEAAGFPRVFTLRDYHAENLLWLAGRGIGLLDFQDAVKGWDAWDLNMLINDARRPVSATAKEAALTTYIDHTGTDVSGFQRRLAVVGALNALRIAGVFARLRHRDGKSKYAAFQPRQIEILAAILSAPELSSLRSLVKEATPFVFERVA